MYKRQTFAPQKHACRPYHMLRSLLLTLLLGIVFFLAPTLGISAWIHPTTGYMILFFLGISFLIHRLMEFGFSNKRDKFVEFYLSTVVIRLLLCIVFVGFFLYRGCLLYTSSHTSSDSREPRNLSGAMTMFNFQFENERMRDLENYEYS